MTPSLSRTRPDSRHAAPTRRLLPVHLASIALRSLLILALTPCAPAALRLHPPQPTPDGLLRLTLETTDASALTPDRVSRIEFIAAEHLGPASGSGTWRPIAGQPYLTEGRVRLDHRPTSAPPQLFFAARESHPAPALTEVRVNDAAGLRTALANAQPGTRILLAPGEYPGGLQSSRLQGQVDRPIIIAGADPNNPPVLRGGANGLQLNDPAFVELHDLTFTGATGNGLNLDDGGSFESPAHDILLRRLRVLDVGPNGNRDGIKLSGVIRFRIEECTIERWGSGGSAVDMVGCHDGLLSGNTFRHTAASASGTANGVQTKGGSRNIVILRNRFENAGARSVNLGGSTGLEFFRPPLVAGTDAWEAKDIRVEGNTFVGSASPIAFVGVDGAVVRFNTLYRPGRWAIRILQETTAPGFVPCRNGQFTRNLVIFHSTQWSSGGVNVGGGTDPQSFAFSTNWWYCLDLPNRSRPSLSTAEIQGTYGVSPQLRDPDAGDFLPATDSPAAAYGAGALPR